MRPTLRVLDDAQHELVLQEALRILAEVGVRVAGTGMRQRLLEAGFRADLSSGRVALHLPGPAWDRDARVAWAAKGGSDVVTRATAEVERLLSSYEPPQIDAAVDREARAIIRAGMAGDAELPA